MNLNELVIKCCMQVYVCNPVNLEPRNFGSGCILKVNDRFVFMTVAHVLDKGVQQTVCLDIGTDPSGFTSKLHEIRELYTLERVDGGASGGGSESEDPIVNVTIQLPDVDFAFGFMQSVPAIEQPRFPIAGRIFEKSWKKGIDAALVAEPDTTTGYGFFGLTRHDVKEPTIRVTPFLTHGLRFIEKSGDYLLFNTRETEIDAVNYKGCSGAPIFSNDGKFVGIVSSLIEGSKTLFAFSAVRALELVKELMDSK